MSPLFSNIQSDLDLNGPILSTQKTISIIDDETTFTVSPALPDGSTSIDLSTLTSDFSNFATSTIYDLTANGSFTLTMELDGGAGGPGDSAENFGLGGKGGNVRGTVSFESGVTYKLVIGSLGVKNGAAGAVGGGGASGGSDNSQTSPTKGGAGGSGGGFTGLFKGSVSQANALLIAGGGGGGSFESDPDDNGGFNLDRKADGGDGGGLQGGFINPTDINVSNASLSGSGGTQLSAGSGGSSNEGGQGIYAGSSGSALQGCAGSAYNDTGGGGGGYFGGGGGGYQASTINGSGGGGSGFIATTNIIDAYFNKATNTGGGAVKIIEGSANNLSKKITGIATAQFPEGQSSRNTNTGNIIYNWYEEGVGPLSDGTNIIGTATTTLSLLNTSFADNGRKFFLRADYENSAYFQNGIAKSTANAANEPFDSGVVTLVVPPKISITSQPVDSTVVQNIDTIFSVTAKVEDDSDSQTTFDWHYNGQSLSTSLSNLTTSVSNSVSAEGATSSLTIKNSSVELSKISCVITNATASPSSISTNEVNFDVGSARTFIQWEKIGDGARQEQGSRDLATSGPFTARARADIGARIIQMFSPEKDIDVKITLGAAAGASRGSNRGGEGGISVFRMTMKKNFEYTVKLGINYYQGGGPRGGINGGGGLAVIYEKATVIAVCGGGGGAGAGGRGGDGGGCNVLGENGGNGGNGGAYIGVDALPVNGMTQAGRSGASDFDNGSSGSGRLSGCTIGKYWREQGKLPCEDVGTGIHFFGSVGDTLSNTTTTITGGMIRGYKTGQGFRNNGGAGSGNGGGGGAGARGGEGSSNGGGGGASGYHASEVTLLSSNTLPNGTQLGGNADVAFISVETYSVSDDQEPLIPPASGIPQAAERTVTWTITRNAGDSNTVTFSKQSGNGPSAITFGPTSGTQNSQISSGAVYTRTGSSASGGRGLSFRLSGNTLQLDDNLDNDFNDLQITPNIGRFTSDSRWEANW